MFQFEEHQTRSGKKSDLQKYFSELARLRQSIVEGEGRVQLGTPAHEEKVNPRKMAWERLVHSHH